MSKGKNQRLKLLYVKQILEEYTDADHGITLDRIVELLRMRGVMNLWGNENGLFRSQADLG